MRDEPYRDVRWSHLIELPVLGVKTKFATNSAEVFEVIREMYGSWSVLDGRDIVSPSDATVKIILQEEEDGSRAIGVGPEATLDAGVESAPKIRHRVPDPTRLLVLSDSAAGVADTVRMEAVAYVPSSLVARRAEFIDGVLEPLTLWLLNALDRQPLHATAVTRDGVAILLAGPSGTGKSTLTYAASRHGFTVLGDEPISVQIRPQLRVWARESRLRLPLEARDHFPELREIRPTRLPSGKTKIVVSPVDDEGKRYADQAGICLLRRGNGPAPEITRISPEQIAAELEAQLDPGFDLFADTIGERIRKVAERGAWCLDLVGPPIAALPLLDEIAAALIGRD